MHVCVKVVDVQSEASASASVDCGRSAPLLTLGLPGVSAEPLTRCVCAEHLCLPSVMCHLLHEQQEGRKGV